MTLKVPRRTVVEAVARALAEDLEPLGDLTASLLDPERQASVVIVARASGVVSGLDCVVEAFEQIDPTVAIDVVAHDGARVAPGQPLVHVSGSLASIVTAERTALNFLGHLSGIATATRTLVDIVHAVSPTVRVLDTRKTTPGLRALEKAAVRAGGGTNHRANLSDAILLKDNHLGGISITDAVARARAVWPGRNVEVECDVLAQVDEAAHAGATSVLLDNMDPDAAAIATELARSISPTMLIEVSGGITHETAAAYAAAGVDLISVGALTHSAPALDVGLDLSVGGA